jgi:hypothetical protein
MNIVFYIILGYLLYRFIFSFLIPVIRTTRKVRKGFKNMQEHMNNHMNGNNGSAPSPNIKETRTPKKGDYIDFEEIKD